MNKNIIFTKREIALIKTIRELRFGKIEIDVRDSNVQAKIKQKEKVINLDDYLTRKDKEFIMNKT